MLVTLSRHVENAISNFINAVNSIDEIVECYHLTGSSDYLLKIMVKDIAAYENLASKRIASIEGIGHLQSMVILSTIKNAKKLPLKYESEVKSSEPEMAV
jgi:DNA-binding Lrp family transcriptional regulator